MLRPLFTVSLLILAIAPGVGLAAPPPPLQGVRLVTSEPMVDVGDDVLLTVTARAWPAAASAVVSFLSPHHGFTGRMLWNPSCSCFRASVQIARRVHMVEKARAVATIRIAGRTITASTTFLIRGLAPGGKALTPAGPPTLIAWVSDPAPHPTQYQHYCGWLRTLDSRGVAGIRIQFVAHYPTTTMRWQSGPTAANGVACIHKPVGAVPPGKRIVVDVHARGLSTTVSFTPRA